MDVETEILREIAKASGGVPFGALAAAYEVLPDDWAMPAPEGDPGRALAGFSPDLNFLRAKQVLAWNRERDWGGDPARAGLRWWVGLRKKAGWGLAPEDEAALAWKCVCLMRAACLDVARAAEA